MGFNSAFKGLRAEMNPGKSDERYPTLRNNTSFDPDCFTLKLQQKAAIAIQQFAFTGFQQSDKRPIHSQTQRFYCVTSYITEKKTSKMRSFDRQ